MKKADINETTEFGGFKSDLITKTVDSVANNADKIATAAAAVLALLADNENEKNTIKQKSKKLVTESYEEVTSKGPYMLVVNNNIDSWAVLRDGMPIKYGKENEIKNLKIIARAKREADFPNSKIMEMLI